MNNIYPSIKVRPYVYFGVNRITGQFYYGYREKNVQLNKPSHIDLFEYKTSSKNVRPIFDDFDWSILVECERGDDSFDIEQEMICEHWDNPLLLNKQYRLPNGKKRFKSKNRKGQGKGKKKPMRTAKHSAAISLAKQNKSKEEKQEIANKISKTLTGRPSPKKGIAVGPMLDLQKENIANSLKGKSKPTRTAEHNANQSKAKKGIPWTHARREAQEKRKNK